MAGRLARDAPHLDGSEPIGLWFDVAWSVYADLIAGLDKQHLDAIESAYEDITATHDTANPTMEDWGTSASAQAAQANLMSMVGGMPPAGPASSPDPTAPMSGAADPADVPVPDRFARLAAFAAANDMPQSAQARRMAAEATEHPQPPDGG